MKNTVEIPSQKRNNVKAVVFALILCAIAFLTVVFAVLQVNRNNLNGLVQNHEGVVKRVYNDDGLRLELEDGKVFTLAGVEDMFEWEEYVGKNVTLISPNQQWGNSDTWVLGFVVDGETLIDFHQQLESRRDENVKTAIAFGVISGALIVAVVILILVMRKKPKTQEENLEVALWQAVAMRQPPCKQQKYWAIYTTVWIFALLLSVLAFAIVCEMTDILPLQIVLAVFMCLMCFGGSLGMFLMRKYVAKKEIEFYVENYPFDFTDISHAPLKKKIKAQVQQQNIEDREKYPHNHPECGNALDAEFTKDGIILRNTANFLDDFIEQSKPQGVFDELDEGGVEQEGNYVIKFSYDELNLVAVPLYRKYDHPLGIIIKSRLRDDVSYPQEIVNDLHFVFERNLLNTIRQFGIYVEGLDYILENKEQLMRENCPKSKMKAPIQIK